MSDEVGYGRPPVSTQFKKGESGNPGGKRRAPSARDAISIFTAPIRVSVNGRSTRVDPYELMLTKLFENAMKGDMGAAAEMVSLCRSAGLLQYQGQFDEGPSSATAPKEWPFSEWLRMWHTHGPPPWKGPLDGLIPEERRAPKRSPSK